MGHCMAVTMRESAFRAVTAVALTAQGHGSILDRVAFRPLRVLDGFENTAEPAAAQLPTLTADAGFCEIDGPTSSSTVWGRLELGTAGGPAPN